MEHVRAIITEEWHEQIVSEKRHAVQIAAKHSTDPAGVMIQIFVWPERLIDDELSSVDIWNSVRQSTQRQIDGTGRLLPDLNRARTFSNGVIAGYSSAQVFMRSGLNTYIARESAGDESGRPTIAAAWWHHPAVELLGWSASRYRERGYEGNIVIEIALDGVEGVALWFQNRGFGGDHMAIEDAVRTRSTTTLASAVDDPAGVVRLLSLNLCAAFNVQTDNAGLRNLI